MSGRARRRSAALLLAALATATVTSASEPPAREWRFEVRLDERAIGEHRFLVSGEGDRQQLRGEARFTVRLLGVPVYRYRHTVAEQWRGDCLQALQAETDDNGRTSEVRGQRGDAGWQVRAPAGSAWPDCVMSFAYWHPALLSQTRLLNPQTGRIEPVKVERAGTGTLPVRGRPVPAVRWRLQTAEQAIDVWLALSDGDWVGLDSTLDSGRRLSYRLP